LRRKKKEDREKRNGRGRKLLPYAFDTKGIKIKVKVQSYLSSCLSLGK
jgi:hypothetical protein